jgi:ssDNA-binding Zn-finger/Zn-ribbon topoisomerase 1
MAEQVTPELKPCPFCGGAITLDYRASGRLVAFLCGEASTCRGSGLGQYAAAESLETAVDCWNRRPIPHTPA